MSALSHIKKRPRGKGPRSKVAYGNDRLVVRGLMVIKFATKGLMAIGLATRALNVICVYSKILVFLSMILLGIISKSSLMSFGIVFPSFVSKIV